jgi:hypothetical protein
MVVQNRCYAALGWDKEVREICQTHGIIYQGFSLLTANREVLVDSDLRAIAKRLGTGPAQVIFCHPKTSRGSKQWECKANTQENIVGPLFSSPDSVIAFPA